MRKTAFIIALLLAVFFISVGNSELSRRFEHWAYDLGVYFSLARPGSDRLVVVAIDDAAIEHYGPWPWTRDILAAAQRRINQGMPRVVAYNISLEASHNERGLEIMGEFRDENAQDMSGALKRRLQQAVNRLDSDHTLAMSWRNTDNIVLSLAYQPGASLQEPLSTTLLPHSLAEMSDAFVGGFADWPSLFRPTAEMPAARFFLPAPKLGSAATQWATGDDYLAHVDGARSLPLVVRAGQYYFSSLPLSIAAVLNRAEQSELRLLQTRGVALGQRIIETDNAARVYPYFYKGKNGQPAFETYSINDVIDGRVDPGVFTDKAVLIGLTANRFSEAIQTPLGDAVPSVMLLANNVSSLLQNDLYQLNSWSYSLRYAAVLLVALYLMLFLPGLRAGTGLAVSVLLVLVLLNVQLFFMLTQLVWVPMMLAVAVLICGHALLAVNRSMHAKVHGYKEALTVSNLQLGQALQSQGQLDQAYEKYKSCVSSETVLAALYSLAEDYERKRQFNKAAEVFGDISGRQRKYRDVDDRIQKNKTLDQTVLLGNDRHSSHTATLLLTNNGVQKPVLGRYEVEKEIGRGAMGMVYLGRDPKIGRTVAIKTMAFSHEFEAANAEDIKQRFLREANAAGRLKHPNIVTIYDVGEEKDLSYIAMDYLEGNDMASFVDIDKRLPVVEVLEVVAQVADALHYAHDNGVIHRDIKPDNIIYNPENAAATVTDFGVACLTDASTTKTGIVLGSPSYMSPEQLSGAKVDGRSDLFSLGVTLYQLFAGELPFKAETLSSLMYKIANDKHIDIRKIRDDLPSCVSTIINRALQKKPDDRFKDGKQMSASLRRCKEKV